MEGGNYWEKNGQGAAKFESFKPTGAFGRGAKAPQVSPRSEDDTKYRAAFPKKGKVSRQDPMSHRIIEKRRRDRMNNCLADLSRLIPNEYTKKGRGRVEKTEIIEMATSHLKSLQNQLNAMKRTTGVENFKAGFQEAAAEVIRYLVDVQRFTPGEGLCLQTAAHLQKHCENIAKGLYSPPSAKLNESEQGSSSMTTSPASTSSNESAPNGDARSGPRPVIRVESYDTEKPSTPAYPDYDRASLQDMLAECETRFIQIGPLQSDNTQKQDTRTTLQEVRKPEQTDSDYLHNYKFKNSIERRFSKSQDEPQAVEDARNARPHAKRRRVAKQPPTSASTSTSDDAQDTSPQDTSSDSHHSHEGFEKASEPQYVPVFALNAQGKYYVPLSVNYDCLVRTLPVDTTKSNPTPLHPVTINVNFSPYLNYIKREEPEWRTA